MHTVKAKLGQADAGDNEAKLMTKLAPDWVRTSDPVIRRPARYRWPTAPALQSLQTTTYINPLNAIHCFSPSLIVSSIQLRNISPIQTENVYTNQLGEMFLIQQNVSV